MPRDDDIESLVKKAKDDPRAFAEIYELYFNRIYAYARYKVGNSTDAEDITEQVFLRALESLDAFKWRGYPFSSWLFRIAHNQVVDYFRVSNKRSWVTLDEAAVKTDSGVSVESEIDLMVDTKMLKDAMSRLSSEQQDVLILKFVNGLSNNEVAQIFGRTEGAIKSLQHRALKNLKKILKVKDDD